MELEEKYPKDFQGFLAQFTDEKHLEYNLDEFAFCFNRKLSTHRGKLFYRLMQQAVTTSPVTYMDITNNLPIVDRQ